MVFQNLTRKADGIPPPLVKVQPPDNSGGRSWAAKPKTQNQQAAGRKGYETMIKNIKHEEYTHKGHRVILDTAQLSPGIYETMLYRASDRLDIDSATAATEAEALEQYASIRAAYPPDSERPAPVPIQLTGKYAQLRDDLKKALEAGRVAEDADPEDGGTCNLDAAALALPRWNAEKVKQAAKEAGTGCFLWKLFNSRLYVFIPNTRGQGNARSRNAEAMTAALRSMGYDAMDYSQMD